MPEFALIPFPSEKTPAIAITGNIKRRDNQLSIQYEVNGDIGEISFPTPSTSTSRKDDLWKATCFELFLAIPDQPQYWEFNISPSGDWNVYKMDAYRQVNMREEAAFSQLPFEFTSANNLVSLKITVDINPFFQVEQELQIGAATIVQTRNGDETYWALIHPGPQADFHIRESFILSL